MKRDQKYGLLFISPATVFFLLFWIFPVLLAIFYGFTNWKVGRPADWVGLKNYIRLFTDPQFHGALMATIRITIPSLIGSVGLSLFIASLLNDEGLLGKRVFLLIVMLPVVTDWVATGLVWQLIFLPNAGVLAGVFGSLGIHSAMGLRWTTNRALAPLAISMFIIWKTAGLYTVIFLAGLKGIPKRYLEAAQIDGANRWQSFISITLPLLRPIFVYVLVVAFVSIVGYFEPIFMLTGGGPADATRTLPIFLYQTFFQFHNGGSASAAGIVFLLLCLGFVMIAARSLQYTYYE